MRSKTKKKSPEVVFREGRPAAVILDIAEYKRMLERLEDMEDLRTLESMRKRPQKFRSLDDFLREHRPSV
jgi:PHD/YefM family antitoxin component YafN of YafNO toxin-antitoxin module